MKKKYLWFIPVIILLGFAAWGPLMSNVEQAKYNVFKSHGSIEIRDYAPMIVAQVEVQGVREVAINQGFRMIADYIFGNNMSSEKVAMTAPVIQQSSETIAMTAPVIQQRNESGVWKVQFIMPSSYSMETLPKPNNDRVELIDTPAKRYAVIRFSGVADNKKFEHQKNTLKTYIDENFLPTRSEPIFAFFNPPWTLPFLRRNEVMIEIGK